MCGELKQGDGVLEDVDIVTEGGEAGAVRGEHVGRADCVESVHVDVAKGAFEADDAGLAVEGAGGGAGWGGLSIDLK